MTSRPLPLEHMVLLGLLVLSVGCGCSRERVVFQDVLESDCAPPCWRGVIPGSTDRQEMLELLHEPPDPSTGLPMDWGDRVGWGRQCVNGSYFSSQVTVNLDPDDVVESITLIEPEEEPTFQDIVEEFGAPAVMLMTLCVPDTDQGLLYLVYSERGVALGSDYLPTLGRPWQQPSAETRVVQWVYFAPIPADRFPAQGPPIYGCGMPSYNETSPWQGFEG